MHGELEAVLQSEGMTVEQWRVLYCLEDKGGQPMGELAQQVLMNHPALTKLADRMVANGHIYRVVDPNDQRRVLVHISDTGRSALERLQRLETRHSHDIEEAFGASKSAALKALLEDLAESRRELPKRQDAIVQE